MTSTAALKAPGPTAVGGSRDPAPPSIPPVLRLWWGNVSRKTNRTAPRITAPAPARNRNRPRQSVTAANRPPSTGPDDRGESADHRQAAVVPHQLAARVQITAGGLRDHDADRAGQSLQETRDDQRSDARTQRAQRRGADVGSDASTAADAAASSRSDRGPATSCPSARPIRHAVTVSCAVAVAAPSSLVNGKDGQVEIHRDRPEHGEGEPVRRSADRPTGRSGGALGTKGYAH